MYDNESTLISVIRTVLDAEAFNALLYAEPLGASLLIESFNEFLASPKYTKLNRQFALLGFLRNKYNLDITREVVQSAATSVCKDDYTKIIMEWQLTSSDDIRRHYLSQVDGEGFVTGDNYHVALTPSSDYILNEVFRSIMEGTIELYDEED